jgi:hypothetical protein
VSNLERKTAHDRAVLNSLNEQVQMMAGEYQAVIDYDRPQVSLDPPSPVTPAIPRSAVVDEVSGKLDQMTWVSIVGEPGSGKTQLCLLTADKRCSASVWINLRGLSQEESCRAIDAALEAKSKIRRHPIIREWYRQISARIDVGTLIVLDDLPRIFPGSALDQRLHFLQAACKERRLRMLSTSYFELSGALLEWHLAVEVHAPRFTSEEILDLLQIHEAPPDIANSNFADLLSTSTGGLPVLVAAVVRFLAANEWTTKPNNVLSLLTGEYASGIKRDAAGLIMVTVPDDRTRELLYRICCVTGSISKSEVEIIGKTPTKIELSLEKLDQLVGLWLQPYGGDTYLLSPLIDRNLARRLDSGTRQRVHAALGIFLLRKRLTSTFEVIVCVDHFREAGLLDAAAIIMSQAIFKLMERETEVPNEWMISSIWASEPLPSGIDINLRLLLRAAQIAFAEARKRDHSFLTDDLEQLLSGAEANPEAQLGVLMASSLLAIRLLKTHPGGANRYLLMALGSKPQAVLPDGSKLTIPKEMALEQMLWGTAISTTSEAEVDDWLETLNKLSPEQLKVLAESELAQDNAVVLCDSIWLREYQKPTGQRNWESVEKVLNRVEDTASKLGLSLVKAAAIRTRIVIIAENNNQLSDAVAIAEDAVKSFDGPVERFLIEEVTGRQLAYGERWEEALRWMGNALQYNLSGLHVIHRNLLITVSECVARYSVDAAAEYSSLAVEVAKSSGLPPVRIAEALGEHSIALWDAGRRKEAFTVWQEGVQIILEHVEQGIQTFLAFGHVSGYFSSMALSGRPPSPTYVVPKPGFFLNTLSMRADQYRPVQQKLLPLQTAVFAEAVQDAEAVEKWARLTFDDYRSEPGSDLILPFLWLGIAPEILSARYEQAIALALRFLTITEPSEDSLATIAVGPESARGVQNSFLRSRSIEASLLFGIVPLAFRLASIRLAREISPDLETIVSYVHRLTGEGRDEWKAAINMMGSILRDEVPWERLDLQAASQYSDQHPAVGMLCLLGSTLTAPEVKSLATQVALAKELERAFTFCFSIRYRVLEPFFVSYWERVITSGGPIFRTSASYTRAKFDEALSSDSSVRLKKLLGAMVFCVGLSLPDGLRNWIDN